MKNQTKHAAPKKPRAKKKPAAKKNPRTKSDADDGGIVALSGFLYQILGFVGLKALAESADGKSVTQLAPEVLVNLVREADSIHYEGFGQDMDIEKLVPGGQNEITLIQFKYSRDGNTLTPAQFREVVQQLLLAAARVVGQGKAVGKSFLITNRPLSPGMATIWEKKTAPKWTKEEIALLKTIDLSVKMELQNWRAALERFGVSFGLSATEIATGIDRLVGHVITSAVGQKKCTLDLATLADCLCLRANSHSLDRKALQGGIAARLAKYRETPPGELVRRFVLREAERLHHDRALIVFAGRGGTGKTASLYRWTEEQAQAAHPRLAAFRDACALPQNWLPDLLYEWSGGFTETTTNEAVLLRLETANPEPSAPPLLHLSLDGLDEWSMDGGGAGNVQKLLRWFWELDLDRFTSNRPAPRARAAAR